MGVRLTEHVDSGIGSLLLCDSVHVPPGVNVTTPVGVVGVALVSVTVAVHVDADPMSTDAGRHVMAVVVRLPVPVTVADPELVAWVESPP